MPGGDRTGPWGAGPMTGRAAGHCAGYGRPGFMNPQFGRGHGGYGRWAGAHGGGAYGRGGCDGGFGRGFGRGAGRGAGTGAGMGFGGGSRGWRHWYHATGLPRWARFGGAVPPAVEPGPDEERRFLESQAAALQDELEAIRARLNALAGPPAAK